MSNIRKTETPTTKVALISFIVNSINIRALSAYLKQNGIETTCIFFSGHTNQENLEALVNLLAEKEISLVGLSVVTDDFQSAVELTQTIKGRLDVKIIWGGAHVNVCPEESLHFSDMICLGEGEEALLNLAQNISEKKYTTDVPNIWFNTEQGIKKNDISCLVTDLDKYDAPDFDFRTQYVINQNGIEKMQEKHLNGAYSVMTSRGCPYNCHYCYNSYRRAQYLNKGKFVRTRSVDHVINELLIVKERFPSIVKVNFWDDSFVVRKTTEIEYFKEQYMQKIDVPFFALMEPMAFRYEKIKLLRDAGLFSLQVGIQSGSERVNREVYNRHLSNEKVLSVANSINELGINVKYDVIFNNPYETLADLLECIKLFLNFPHPYRVMGYNLVFFPGTFITQRALNDGYISKKKVSIDFSTILTNKDSPVAMKGRAEVSSRFYHLNYCSRDKEYLNSVICLFAYRHISNELIEFLIKSDGLGRKTFLRTLLKLHEYGSNLLKMKRMIRRKLTAHLPFN